MSGIVRAILAAASEEELRELAVALRPYRDTGRAEPDPASPFLTVVEAAELLRCQPQRIRDLLSQRRLSKLKEGGRTLIRRSEVEALVVEQVAVRVPRVSSDVAIPLTMRLREAEGK